MVKEDADRLGIRSGLGLKKAASIKRAAERFARDEQRLYAETRERLAREAAESADAAEGNGVSEDAPAPTEDVAPPATESTESATP